jgi:hypothetical protein
MWPAASPFSVQDQPQIGGTPLLFVSGPVTPIDLLHARVTALEQEVRQLRQLYARVEAVESTLATPWWRRLWTWLTRLWMRG